MSDPLSIGAGVAGLLSLGIQVTSSLVQFYSSYKSQESDVIRITKKLETLLETFRALETAVASPRIRTDQQTLLNKVKNSILDCKELIDELQEETRKFTKASEPGFIERAKISGRKIAYPFRQSTLQKLDEDIKEIRSNLSFALDVLQLEATSSSASELEEIKLLLELVSGLQISANIRDWLKAPDPTINHNEACLKRHPNTGLWFVESLVFKTWLDADNSFLWLNGFAGCGKSVLCSTVIQSTFRHRRSNPQIGIAFFYFNFNDKSKQDLLAMLSSLLLQLSSQLKGRHEELAKLQARYSNGLPTIPVLVDNLQYIIKRYQDVYIIVDAIDESPKDSARGSVLEKLWEMRQWSLKELHLLVTSRDEPDIREELEPLPKEDILLKNAGVDKDIANMISDRLKKDRKLKRWSKFHDLIKDGLIEGAQGVFRWVECQFKSLQDCPSSEYHLKELLTSLPRSLDETYERMLCNIDNAWVEDARRILTLLCVASRPLTLYELIEGIAVDTGEQGGLDCSRRLHDENDIRRICPGLVDVVRDVEEHSRVLETETITTNIHIAHFSVQEYLQSERISISKAARFAINSAQAHNEAAKVCLIYLCAPQMSQAMEFEDITSEYPLSSYVARNWQYHYRMAEDSDCSSKSLVLNLFKNVHNAFQTWMVLYDIDHPWKPKPSYKRADDIPSPVYCVSLLGLTTVLGQMLKIEQELDSTAVESQSKSDSAIGRLLNAQGGHYRNALQAASIHGHKSIVQLLLANGANVNAQGGNYGNALQAASIHRHKSIVQLLFANGANINAQGGDYGNALQAASAGGHESIVQLLLANGADINAQGGHYGNALQAASAGGYESIVQLLFANGADINAQGGHYRNALQAASVRGHKSTLQLLLANGAKY